MRAASLELSVQYVVAAQNSTLTANKLLKKIDDVRTTSDAGDDAHFMLDEYDSEEELKAKTATRSKDPGLSSASLHLMQKLLCCILSALRYMLTVTYL